MCLKNNIPNSPSELVFQPNKTILGISPNKLAQMVPIIQRKGAGLTKAHVLSEELVIWDFVLRKFFFLLLFLDQKKRSKIQGTSPHYTKDPENFWELVLLGCFCLLHKNWICKRAKTMGLTMEKYNYHSHSPQVQQL